MIYVLGLAEPLRTDEPWNSTFNSKYAESFSYMFCHPGELDTYILAVTGPGTAFPPDGGVEMNDLDGDTILLLEVADSGIHWMKPGDFVFDQSADEKHQRFSHTPGNSRHETFAVVYADGEIWFLVNETPVEELEKFFTIEDAKKYDRDVVLKTYLIERFEKI